MCALPANSVTFLFTDIEGSTQLWEQHPEAMQAALARHDNLLRRTIESHDGHVFKTVGDAFCAAFASPLNALHAAVQTQREVLEAPWELAEGLLVRTALHTGPAQMRDDDYFGIHVNRVARLIAIGHGGQILLSHATRQLLPEGLPGDLSLRDLGEHVLRDLIKPERVFQVLHPDLPTEFLPLKSINVRDNLPVQATALVGREGVVEDARRLLTQPDTRLVTLTGPGGVGKTRVALQVAAEALDKFPDGVRFIALAPINDPDFVIPALARVLGVQEIAGRPLLESTELYLRDKQMLLVLDNFEQVRSAAQLIAELLSTAPAIKVLVTSRAALHLRGEQEYAVTPLPLPPDSARHPRADDLTEYAAVALFVERATDAMPDFRITDDNALAVSEICRRVDGLPLAIELAAARIKVLPPHALSVRLQSRLKLLTSGPRDLPARQQTLRDAIAWSYDLLPVEQQRLFRRLAVFAGGCTLEAAEAVSSDGERVDVDVLEGLSSLVDMSLLRPQEQPDGEPRFLMLETIREFALERLISHSEADPVRQQHAEFFAELVEEAGPHLHGGARDPWLPRLAAERDNLRAAMRWSLDSGVPEIGLRIIAPLWLWFWFEGVAEGRRWADELLSAPGADRRTRTRGWALFVAAALAFAQGDVGAVRSRCEESESIAEEVGDKRLRALALAGRGSLMFEDPRTGRAKVEKALELARESGDAWVLAFASQLGGMLEGPLGNAAAARCLLEAAVSGFESVGDHWAVSLARLYLGIAALQDGDDERARDELERSLPAFQRTHDKKNASLVLTNLAQLAQRQARTEQAAALFIEALSDCHEVGDRPGAITCLEGLAGVALQSGDSHRAARLLGATAALKGRSTTVAAPLPARPVAADDPAAEEVGAPDRATYVGRMAEAASQRTVEATQALLGPRAYAAAWQQGRALSLDEALDDARGMLAEVTA